MSKLLLFAILTFPVDPEFPVYIDAFRTGSMVSRVLCEVTDEQNVITPDSADYASITIVADVTGTACCCRRFIHLSKGNHDRICHQRP